MNENIFNPKKPFRSVTELGNYIKEEFTDEKIEKAIKKMYKPITVIDPLKNQHKLENMLKVVDVSTPEKKRKVMLVLSISRVCCENAIRGIKTTRKNVLRFVAKFLGEDVKKIEEEEKKLFIMLLDN